MMQVHPPGSINVEAVHVKPPDMPDHTDVFNSIAQSLRTIADKVADHLPELSVANQRRERLLMWIWRGLLLLAILLLCTVISLKAQQTDDRSAHTQYLVGSTWTGVSSGTRLPVTCDNCGGSGGGGGTSSNFGSMFPTAGTAAGASDGTNMQPLLVDGSGFLKIAQQGSVAVTGTFWQATQPVSGAISFIAPQHTICDSGCFQTTQPVSLASTTVTGSVAVTGTFWQTTQPVSGTFWQTTQPVSIASLPALAAGSNVIGHVIVDTAPTTAVTGTFWQSTQPVSLASLPALASGSATVGSVKLTDGTNTQVVDPCAGQAKVYTPISLTAGATLITGTSAKKTYLCAVQLTTATAQNIAIVEGTGTVCATSTLGLMGGATAGTGWNFAANGGLTFGNGGAALAATTVNANNICLLTSSSGQISGNLVSVVQ